MAFESLVDNLKKLSFIARLLLKMWKWSAFFKCLAFKPLILIAPSFGSVRN